MYNNSLLNKAALNAYRCGPTIYSLLYYTAQIIYILLIWHSFLVFFDIQHSGITHPLASFCISNFAVLPCFLCVSFLSLLLACLRVGRDRSTKHNVCICAHSITLKSRFLSPWLMKRNIVIYCIERPKS